MFIRLNGLLCIAEASSLYFPFSDVLKLLKKNLPYVYQSIHLKHQFSCRVIKFLFSSLEIFLTKPT